MALGFLRNFPCPGGGPVGSLCQGWKDWPLWWSRCGQDRRGTTVFVPMRLDHAVSLSFGRVFWVFGKFEVVIMELIHNIAWTSAVVGALSLKNDGNVLGGHDNLSTNDYLPIGYTVITYKVDGSGNNSMASTSLVRALSL